MKRTLLVVLLALSSLAFGVTETVVYNFDGSTGQRPNQYNWITPSGCTANTSYGTVVDSSDSHVGKIFSLDTSGTYTVIASGQIPNGGNGPSSPLVEDPSTCALYGVVQNGSTVYKLTQSGGVWTATSLGNAPGGTTNGQLVRIACVGNTNHTCIYGISTNFGGGSGTLWKLDESTTPPSFTTLHVFTGTGDGLNPVGGVVIKGTTGRTLYGVTVSGGTGTGGLGTVYSYDLTNSTYTVIYSFQGGTSDGSHPQAAPYFDGLGNMYGTTQNGGSSGVGVVWKLDNNGNESIIHQFTGGTSDLNQPFSRLVSSGTALYGTAIWAGANNAGGVYKLVQDQQGNWIFSIVYSFAGGTSDGNHPYAPVVFWNSGIYVLTWQGGTGNCSSGCGTIVKVVE